MNGKNIQNPGKVFKSFSHKAKINPGNVNDDELMRDIQEITEKIDFEKTDVRSFPFMYEAKGLEALREDIEEDMDSTWIKSAKATKDNYICVSKIIDEKDV